MSLSLPEVVAALAPALGDYETKNAGRVGLINKAALNTMLVLVVVTSMLGPMLTEYFGRKFLAVHAAVAMSVGESPQAANPAVEDVSEPNAAGEIKLSENQSERPAPPDHRPGN